MKTSYIATDKGQVRIIIPQKTRERLAGLCFRPNARLAGNFSRWRDAEAIFRDSEVRALFRADLEEAIADECFGTQSVSIECHKPVGWSSTAPISGVKDDDRERFEPNKKSTGWRVRRDADHLQAPQTSELTIVYALRRDDHEFVATIYSLYPGPDVGELIDDVSEREGVVFFDFAHPGA